MTEFLAQFMPTDASAHGRELDELQAIVHWLMLVLFVAWGAYLVYVIVRFRKSNHPKADHHGAKGKLSKYAEAGVAVFEAVLLIGFSIPMWRKWATPPPRANNPLEVRVVAEQFGWNMHYPGPDNTFGKVEAKLMTASNPLGLDPNDPKGKDDVFSLNQLHVQVKRPVIVRITAKDVIHSFSLPNMRVKQDAIPGMEVPVHFTPMRTNNGEKWEIACAQLCGLGHYRMRGFLTVDTKEDFDKFLRDNAQGAMQ